MLACFHYPLDSAGREVVTKAMAVYGICPMCKNKFSLVEYEREGDIKRSRRSGYLEVRCPHCKNYFAFDPLPRLPKDWLSISVIMALSVFFLLGAAWWLGLH